MSEGYLAKTSASSQAVLKLEVRKRCEMPPRSNNRQSWRSRGDASELYSIFRVGAEGILFDTLLSNPVWQVCWVTCNTWGALDGERTGCQENSCISLVSLLKDSAFVLPDICFWVCCGYSACFKEHTGDFPMLLPHLSNTHSPSLVRLKTFTSLKMFRYIAF